MTIDTALCKALSETTSSYDNYVAEAILVTAGPWADLSPSPVASAVLSLEIIHTDGLCQTPLADACVHVVSRDDDVLFVAPDANAATNYVTCWHRETAPTALNSGWAPMSASQTSTSPEVLLVGQTLPTAIADFPESGAGGGYLHHEPDRPTDGWTVRIGVVHPRGLQGLVGQTFDVAVSARPYWSSTTAFQTLTVE